MPLTPMPALAQATSHDAALRALAPPAGKLLHGVYTGRRSGEEDDIRPSNLDAYIRTVGVKPAWVYFSNNWYRSRDFPTATAKWIRAKGSTPFVRLMLRSEPTQDHGDPLFATHAIANGKFDADLANWHDRPLLSKPRSLPNGAPMCATRETPPHHGPTRR